MGSMPLPALHIAPPAPAADPAEQVARLMQLKTAMQNAPLQQQALQQQVQTGQIQLQEAQQGMKDKQAMSAAMQQWGQPKTPAGSASQGAPMPNYDDLVQLARKNGASFDAIKGLQTSILDMRAKASTIAKDDAETGQKNAETMKAKNGMIVDAMNGVMSLPDQQLPQAIMQTAQELAGKGLLDPQHVQMAEQIAQSGNPSAMRQQIGVYTKSLGGYTQLLAEAQKQAQTYEATARGNEAVVNTNLAPQKLAMQQQNDAMTQKQGQQRIGIESARLKFEQQKASLDQSQSGLTGSDFLATLPPGMQAQVKASANGDIAIPPPGSRNPQAQQLRTAVLTYDPTYTDARYKGKQNFKTSGDAQNIVQLATAMEHADRATANSAQAGFAPALGSKTFESPTSAAYMQDAEFLTGEVGKLVKNGVLTVDESNKISSGLTSARQGVRDAALSETMDLLGGKARGVFQKYKTSTGQDLPLTEFFDGKTQQRLAKYGVVDRPTAGNSSDPFAQFGGKAH